VASPWGTAMHSSEPSLRIEDAPGTATLRRAVLIALVALAAAVSAFAGYYLWDRYAHPGDRSAAEVQVQQIAQAVRDDPQDVAARIALADAYLSAGAYDDALAQAEGVLAVYPEDPGALLIAGIAHCFMDQPGEAVPLLERFITLRQDGAMAQADLTLETAYYFLGESYVELGQPAQGATALEAALAISPTDADALFQLGRAYQHQGQPLAALEQYHRAVRFVPDFGEVYSGMADCYSALDWDAHRDYARAMQAFARGDYEKAEVYLEEATEELSDFSPAHVGLALTYEKRQRLAEARKAAERALELEPGDFLAQTVLARIQNTMGSQD
jgi:tetratricopeptide (TPR) repeat protein